MRKIISTLLLLTFIIIIGFTDFASKINIPDFTPSKEAMSNHSSLEEDEAIIARVIDGDTVIVLNSDGVEERVRLLLIDTPESVHPNGKVELFGPESSEYAKEYLKQGQKVTLEIGNPQRDKYDRLLAYIWVDGVNFNQHMIEKGFARVAYVYEPNTKYLNEFLEAQEKAKEEKLNIWSIEGYVTDDGFDMTVTSD